MPTQTAQPARTRHISMPAWPKQIAHLCVVASAIFLGILAFPRFGETRDMDEVTYLSGSLALLEGVPPTQEASPAGPNTWLGWAYAGGAAAFPLLNPTLGERRAPIQLRPFLALDRAIFENYRDLNQLHILWIGSQIVLAVWAVSAAFRLGEYRGGLAGGLLLGGFMAWLPLF